MLTLETQEATSRGPAQRSGNGATVPVLQKAKSHTRSTYIRCNPCGVNWLDEERCTCPTTSTETQRRQGPEAARMAKAGQGYCRYVGGGCLVEDSLKQRRYGSGAASNQTLPFLFGGTWRILSK